MGVFEKLPYTNYHDLNINWVIKKIKEVAKDNALILKLFKHVEDEDILGVVTSVTESGNLVRTDYYDENSGSFKFYTTYNKTGVDTVAQNVAANTVSPVASRVTTAENDINTLQNHEYYRAGDVYTSGNTADILCCLTGYITLSAKQLVLTISLPKPIAPNTTATLTYMNGKLRSTLGYINSDSSDINLITDSSWNIYTHYYNNMYTIIATNSGTLTNVTNNTPMSFYGAVQIEFS